MTGNDRGFSLIELVIAAAILGVVALGVGRLMVTGAGSFSTVSARVELERSVQQTENQMRKTILGCNVALYADTGGEALYLAKYTREGKYQIDVYTLQEGCLYLQRADGATPPSASTIQGSALHLLAEDASGFSVTVETSPESALARSVTCEVLLTRGEKQRQSTQTIALRNAPVLVHSLTELIAACQ